MPEPIDVDYTTYSKQDPNAAISWTTSVLTFTDFHRDEDAWGYKDFGAGYFNSNTQEGWEFWFDIEVTAIEAAGLTIRMFPCTVVESPSIGPETFAAVRISGGATEVGVLLQANTNTTTFDLNLRRASGATEYGGTGGTNNLSLNTTYYVVFKGGRSGGFGYYTLRVYSDPSRKHPYQIGNTTELTGLTPPDNFRYHEVCQSYEWAAPLEYAQWGTISNMVINPRYTEDLKAEFTVKQNGYGDLKAEFHVGQDSKDLKAEFLLVETATTDLFAKFRVKQPGDPENLFAKLIVRNVGSADLLSEFTARHSAEKELFAEFIARQEAAADLFTQFEVDQENGDVQLFAHLIVKNKGAQDLFSEFIVRHSAAADIPAEFLLRHAAYQDLHAEIIIYHPDQNDLFSKFVVRHSATTDIYAKLEVTHWVDLYNRLIVRNAGIRDLIAELIVRHSADKDFFAKFEVTHWEDLYNRLIVRNKGYRDLPAEFIVRHSGEVTGKLYAKFEVAHWERLYAKFLLRQINQDIPAEFVVRHTATEDLLGRILVTRPGTVELFAEFYVRPDRLSTDIFDIKKTGRVIGISPEPTGQIRRGPRRTRSWIR